MLEGSNGGNVRLERLVRRVLCWVTGHKYRVVQEFSPETRRVKCDRCRLYRADER